jgi:hypothetical protein
MCGGRVCNNYAENAGCRCIEFIRLGKQARGICVTLLYSTIFWKSVFVSVSVVGWLVGWLVCWLVGWLVGWLVVRLMNWFS